MAPSEKLSAYLTPPVEMIPGVAAYYATLCRACPAGCGILVKTREGRPIKLEGNPSHPLNQGKLCGRGQAFIQGLYDRNRATAPMLRKNGRLTAVSWEEALAQVSSKLKMARSASFLTGLESGTFEIVVRELLGDKNPGAHIQYEPLALTSMAAAAEQVFGKKAVPRIDLNGVRHIVSLGADFLDTWHSPVALSRQWAEHHSAGANRLLQMDYLGPRRNLTAAAADRFYPVRSGHLDGLALALAHDVFARKRASLTAAEASSAQSVLRTLGPRPDIGEISKETFREMVNRLVGADPGLVLFGGAEVVSAQATAVHAAVLVTNTLLGSVGSALRFDDHHALDKVESEATVSRLLARSLKGSLELLFLYGTNPAYLFPNAGLASSKVQSLGYRVALAFEMDETAKTSDVVLPVHHPLESWGDYELTRSIVGLMQPVRAPLHQTRHVGDVLIDLAQRAGQPMRHKTYKHYLIDRWTQQFGVPTSLKTEVPASDADAGPDRGTGPNAIETPPVISTKKWEQMLVNGGWFETGGPSAPPPIRVTRQVGLGTIKKAAEPVGGGFDLIVPFSLALYDGRGATQDWLREIPDPMTQTAWEIPIEIAPNVATSKGLKDGDVVNVKSPNGAVKGTVVVETGLAQNTVALRPGGGRDVAREHKGTGNPYSLLGWEFDRKSGELVRSGTKVTLEKVGTGQLVSVMGSPHSEGRLLALSMGLKDYREGRFPMITRHGELAPGEHPKGKLAPVPMPHQEQGNTRPADNMYSLQEHAKHRFGLVVDLDRCTGCSACAVACYAENNIPVVGKKEVSRGRELSWIRVEKHLFGQGPKERVRFLPVMCQQCDNAPCESVCPVFAASHTRDGLNAQIYNRCIGTRYCSNNCPYKVRRFNYFDYDREKPANQQLNPDVTVRSRGVMEKCTFCIQRIREVQNHKKVLGKPIDDGDIVPACVQTCPTGALSFGDFKRQEWVMSKLARDPRGYRLLDYISNTRPGVVYLRKVDTETEENG